MPETIIDPKTVPGNLPVDINSINSDKSDYYNASIPVQLVISARTVYNLNNDEKTQTMMLPFGYDHDKILNFGVVQSEAADANNDQQIEFAEKTIAYQEFEKFFTSAKVELSNLVKVAKVALKNDPLLMEKLNLSGKKGTTINTTLNYMKDFYKNIFSLEGVLPKLAVFGYDEHRLSVCRDYFLNADVGYNKFKLENADAHESTRIRDDKMAELNEWMYDYYTLAKVAATQRRYSNITV